MPRLTIDGRAVVAPEGATVLEAARLAGVRVPTLCLLEGTEPFTSCFLCVVRIEGKADLAPACATPAVDGMVVGNFSEEVTGARRTALELMLSDHFGDCEGPCTLGCPAGMDIPAMLREILAGRPPEAARIARLSIALPASLGCICPRFCERTCRRGELDEPLAIRELKRFAGEAALAEGFKEHPRDSTGKSVAVVGAGAAGLSAAYHLAMLGHAVSVYDAREEPGGALMTIPDFRLPKALVRGEVGLIRRLGVEFRQGQVLGRDLSLEELKKRHDAVFVATGAAKPVMPDMKGVELATAAVEFLEAAAKGKAPLPGGRAVVIGGEAWAIDAARTAKRLASDEVIVLFDGVRRKIPAPEELVAAAEAEGVAFECERRVLAIEAYSAVAAAPAAKAGRRSGSGLTVALEGGQSLEASAVFIGGTRRSDVELFRSQGLEVTRTGIKVDRATLATSVAGVFAGGEAATGPGPAVRAVAAGRLAAVSIDQMLGGSTATGETEPFNSRTGKLTEPESAAFFAAFAKSPRASVADGRLSGEGAPAESARCLGCDCLKKDACRLRDLAGEYGARQGRFKGERRPYSLDESHPAVVYEPGKCIMCGLCVRVAAEAGEPKGLMFLRRGFRARVEGAFGAPIAEAVKSSGERCAEVCPTGAIALKRQAARPSSGEVKA